MNEELKIELTEKYMTLATALAKRVTRNTPWKTEDILSAAKLGLIKGLQTMDDRPDIDPQKAWGFMKWHINNQIRIGLISHNAVRIPRSSYDGTVPEVVCDYAFDVETLHPKSMLQIIHERVPEEHWEVCELLASGYTRAEVAEMLGMPKTSFRTHLVQIRNEME
jgi:DNA-directed RNA polymerase specialized sigma24 family protein